jgi:tight adherence protein B
MPPLFFFLVFLGFLCLSAGGFAYFAGPEAAHQERLRRRLEGETGLPFEDSLLKSPGSGGLALLSQTLRLRGHLERLQGLMLQADVGWHLRTLLLIFSLCGAAGAIAGLVARGATGGLLGGALGVALAYKALALKKKLRLRKFEKQLPEALELMARSLKAGHAFPSGFQMVAAELPNPIAAEFLRTFNEYNHGLDLSLALLNLCQRIDLKDLKFFTTAVNIQRETGGNLAEILEKIAALIRERFKLRRQIMALTAEGRLSGLILILLPPVTALIFFFLNPEYMRLLLTHPLGRTMALTALGFQGLGLLVIRKIINIKV